MSETLSNRQDMIVVLRRHRSILVPPFELAREEVEVDEPPLKAALRISRDYGTMMDIDAEIPLPNDDNAPTYAYLVENYHFLSRSEFLVHHIQVADAVEGHAYLSRLEKQLLVSAAHLLASIK